MTRTLRTPRTLLLSALALALTAVPLAAQPALDPANKDAAAKLVADGSARFAKHDYQGALAKYEAAFQLYPAPKLHFNLALSFAGLGRTGEAADEFAAFLADAADAPADARAQATDQLAKLEPALAKISITSGAGGAAVSIDGDHRGTAPLTAHVTPGKHVIALQVDGRAPWSQPVDVAAGATQQVSGYPLPVAIPETPDHATPDHTTPEHTAPAPLVPRVTPAAPVSAAEHPDEAPGITHRWWFWGAVAVVVAGGAVITYEATRSPSPPSSELGAFKF